MFRTPARAVHHPQGGVTQSSMPRSFTCNDMQTAKTSSQGLTKHRIDTQVTYVSHSCAFHVATKLWDYVPKLLAKRTTCGYSSMGNNGLLKLLQHPQATTRGEKTSRLRRKKCAWIMQQHIKITPEIRFNKITKLTMASVSWMVLSYSSRTWLQGAIKATRAASLWCN